MGALISRFRFVLLAFALIPGCRQEPTRNDRTIFLTNLPTTQVSAGAERPFALHESELGDVALRGAEVGFDKRRAIVQKPGVDVCFHGVPMAGAVLETAVLYRGPPGAAQAFSVEIIAEGTNGHRSVLWQETLNAPADEDDRRWSEILVPLPDELGERGTLCFRSRCAADNSDDGDDSVNSITLRAVPGWSNPKLILRDLEQASAKEQHRNVIVFLIDTLRQDHLGTYGYDRNTSPNIDALAEESLVFTAAHSAAPWTKASVATLFTSQPPSVHGAEDYQDRLSNAAVTLAETLLRAGYRTGAVGYNGWVFNAKFNLLQGFEERFSVIDHKREGGARADSVVAESIDWLDRNRDKPFFLYIHTVDPHEPYVPTAELRRTFQRQEYTGELTGRLEGSGAHNKRKREQTSAEDVDFLHDLYDAEIRFADERLGELIQYLKENGLWGETTLIVTADHGEEFLEHGGWSHGGSLHQEEILVPLVIKPPISMNIPAARIAEAVGLVDLAPTICSLAGVRAEDLGHFGQNLIPLAMAPRLWKTRIVLSELNKEGIHIVSLRRNDRKYMRYLQPAKGEFLFDLASDPGEHENLLANAPKQELERFRRTLNLHLEQTPRAGIVVEFLSSGAQARVVMNVAMDQGQLDYGLVECEREGDHFRQRSEHDHLFELEVGGSDGRDGVRLHLDRGDTALLTFLVRGAEVDPARILLGSSQRPATSAEVSVSDTDESLWVDEPPAWDARDGVWCRIWNLRPQEVVLDDEEIAELKALGYLGD